MDIGYIRFHKFKYKNSEPHDPVPMDKRWWALKESTPDPSDFEAQKARALAARPGVYITPIAGSEAAEPSPAPDGPAAGEPRGKGKVTVRSSPYGSLRVAEVHSESLWKEDDLFQPPPFDPAPDPYDILPPTADLNDLHAPCSVPHNVEARAQWAWTMLEAREWDPRTPVGKLRSLITCLSQLPVRELSSMKDRHSLDTSWFTIISTTRRTSARRVRH